MELFKFGGNDFKVHIVELFNNIVDKSQIPQDWETGIVINIYKKGSKSKYENYRGMTLLPTAYKMFTNIMKNKLNAYLEEEECGFRKGHSCIDAIFTAQQIIEKWKEHNLPLFLLFIDYEKAYDNTNRDMLWKVMEEKIPNSLLKTIKCIYKITKVSNKFNDDTIPEPIQINKA
jgi:sorting nexin-29